MKRSPWMSYLVTGLVGAATTTLLNEVVRRFDRNAPRLDEVGVRGLNAMRGIVKREPLPRRDAYRKALAGDLLLNAATYGLVALDGRSGSLARGLGLGLLSGLGARYLTPRLGLGYTAVARTPRTGAMTIGYYVAGGLAAAAVARAVVRR